MEGSNAQVEACSASTSGISRPHPSRYHEHRESTPQRPFHSSLHASHAIHRVPASSPMDTTGSTQPISASSLREPDGCVSSKEWLGPDLHRDVQPPENPCRRCCQRPCGGLLNPDEDQGGNGEHLHWLSQGRGILEVMHQEDVQRRPMALATVKGDSAEDVMHLPPSCVPMAPCPPNDLQDILSANRKSTEGEKRALNQPRRERERHDEAFRPDQVHRRQHATINAMDNTIALHYSKSVPDTGLSDIGKSTISTRPPPGSMSVSFDKLNEFLPSDHGMVEYGAGPVPKDEGPITSSSPRAAAAGAPSYERGPARGGEQVDRDCAAGKPSVQLDHATIGAVRPPPTFLLGSRAIVTRPFVDEDGILPLSSRPGAPWSCQDITSPRPRVTDELHAAPVTPATPQSGNAPMLSSRPKSGFRRVSFADQPTIIEGPSTSISTCFNDFDNAANISSHTHGEEDHEHRSLSSNRSNSHRDATRAPDAKTPCRDAFFLEGTADMNDEANSSDDDNVLVGLEQYREYDLAPLDPVMESETAGDLIAGRLITNNGSSRLQKSDTDHCVMAGMSVRDGTAWRRHCTPLSTSTKTDAAEVRVEANIHPRSPEEQSKDEKEKSEPNGSINPAVPETPRTCSVRIPGHFSYYDLDLSTEASLTPVAQLMRGKAGRLDAAEEDADDAVNSLLEEPQSFVGFDPHLDGMGADSHALSDGQGLVFVEILGLIPGALFWAAIKPLAYVSSKAYEVLLARFGSLPVPMGNENKECRQP